VKRKTSRKARHLFVSLDRADNVIEGALAFGFKAAGFDLSPPFEPLTNSLQ
jgi:hypothetical protein